jgi:hypothetical protein
MAKQERIRLSERTKAGLEKARKEGRVGGRPKVITDRGNVKELRSMGKSLPAIAREDEPQHHRGDTHLQGRGLAGPFTINCQFPAWPFSINRHWVPLPQCPLFVPAAVV